MTAIAIDSPVTAPHSAVRAASRLFNDDFDAALGQLADLNRQYPADAAIPAIMLQRLLGAGRTSDAAALAMRGIAIAVSNDRLAYMTLLALERGDMHTSAIGLVRAYDGAYPTSEIAGIAVRLAKASDDMSLRASVAAGALASGFDNAQINADLGMMHRDDGNIDAAIAHLTKAVAHGLSTLRVTSSLGGLLLLKGDAKAALPHLRRAAELAPAMPSLLVMLGRAYRALRRFDEAEIQFSAVAEMAPASDRWDRAAIAALSQVGKAEAADAMFRHLVARRERTLPHDFTTGLEGLWDRLDDARIPAPRLDWAWSLRDPAQYANRHEWERRARWGNLADLLILDWLECRTLRAEETMGRLANVETVLGKIEALHSSGKGLIIASAHVGALYAGPLLLELAGFQTKWLASAPSVASAAYLPTLISTSDQLESQVARQAMATLADGQAIAIAVDGAMSLSAPRVTFEGQQITYSAFAARMAHRFDAPSVFAVPQWKDGRIDFLFEMLPCPEPGEAVDAFLGRWRTAWLAALRRALRCEPENLRLGGGIWRNIR